MTRAPKEASISGEPSVLPLSAMMTSPVTLRSSSDFCAFLIHISRVSASLRHGIRIDSSVRLPSLRRSDGAVWTSVIIRLLQDCRGYRISMISREIQINDSIDAFRADRYTRDLVARGAHGKTPIRPHPNKLIGNLGDTMKIGFSLLIIALLSAAAVPVL